MCGVDEAGRGPVIGPLVVAGVVVDSSRVEELAEAGVRDSKQLSPAKREEILEKIESIADRIEYVELWPREIDRVVLSGRRLRKLNYLEAKAMAEVIRRLSPDVAYVDCPDVDTERFARLVAGLVGLSMEVVAEHEADAKYPVVSAASIAAKVRRDELVDGLRREYGDFGSGYPHDPKTLRFLEDWLRSRGEFPPIVRRSWVVVRRMGSRTRCAALTDYL